MNRIQKLAVSLDPSIDAALIVSQANRLYYTGFRSSAGTLLVTRQEAYFFADFRYIQQARQAIRDCVVELQEDLLAQINDKLARHAAGTVAVESGSLPVAQWRHFSACLAARVLEDDRLQDTIDAMRRVKTPEELDCIRRAQKITDDAFSHICNYIRPGITEQDLLLELGNHMERHGSENRNFDLIAVSGPNTSKPHGKATTRAIQNGDLVMFDFGAMAGGYYSDMTRTVAVGHADDEQSKVYATVRKAQERALAGIRPGVPSQQVDALARDYIRQQGYGSCFGHGLGHGVGIEIHENPRFNQWDTTPLAPGMVMTVEPGIYLDGRFGVRIEDMVAVTQTGCENLTRSPKELLVL